MRDTGLKMPTLRESLLCMGGLAVWLTVTILFIGFRPEHIFLAVLIGGLFFACRSTRKLVVALIPFIVFGISYDWMNLLPNYEVNPIDVRALYELEKSTFGIETAVGVLTPNEFFALHHVKWMDFMAGIFYLCWVPLPVFYGLWLYFSGKSYDYLRFALVFLLVNLIGFALYYVHPAAPPWYVASHGFDPVVGTHGEVAGLGYFDEMTGLGIFNALYARNANVFAAMPSLHSAYTFVAFIYAFIVGSSRIWKFILGFVTLGIWTTAVYTSHHYIYDVMGGILCSILAVVLFEQILLRIPGFKKWLQKYADYIACAAKRAAKCTCGTLKVLITVVLASGMLSSCHGSKSINKADSHQQSVVMNDVKKKLDRVHGIRRDIVEEALTWEGTPYKYACDNKGKGTDCSGMVLRLYEDVASIKLPRNSARQSEYCKVIRENDVQPGDLVFFATGKDINTVSHVGIMVDDIHFIHASSKSGVVISDITTPYYRRTFICFGRVPEL